VKIVVIGGSGLIGSKLVTKLRQNEHEVGAASPSSGMNTLTGEGLSGALEGAQVGDPRKVISDPKTRYFGVKLGDRSLTPGDHVRIGPT
jgi:nucleoside-diphosphate-sugar epimerase